MFLGYFLQVFLCNYGSILPFPKLHYNDRIFADIVPGTLSGLSTYREMEEYELINSTN